MAGLFGSPRNYYAMSEEQLLECMLDARGKEEAIRRKQKAASKTEKACEITEKVQKSGILSRIIGAFKRKDESTETTE